MDECGIDTYLYREYGYAPQGQQIFGRISGRKYKRCSIVAAKMADKILAPFQYSGTMDSSLFEFWFSNQLLPSLDKDTVIVRDRINLSVLAFSNGIAVFTFATAHTAIPLEIFVFKRI